MRSETRLMIALGCFFVLLFGGAAAFGAIVLIGAKSTHHAGNAPVVPFVPAPLPRLDASISNEALVIGDGERARPLVCALEHDGWRVTAYGSFAELALPIDRYPVIVLLRGYDYTDPVPEEAQRAIVTRVNAGAGLVVDEWLGYYVDARTPLLAPIMPMTVSRWSTGATTYSVVSASHPIARDLPPTFPVAFHSRGTAELRSGATTVLADADGNPMVIAAEDRGRVVWFAAADAYSSFAWIENAPLTTAFVHAVDWAGRRAPAAFDAVAATRDCH